MADKNPRAWLDDWAKAVLADARLNGQAAALKVAWALRLFFNTASLEAWPSFDTLATMTGFSRRTVIRAVRLLCDLGHLHVAKRGGGTDRNGRGFSNRYSPQMATVTPVSPLNSDTGDRQQCHGATTNSDTGRRPTVTPVSPEPLNEPLSEPLTKSARAPARKRALSGTAEEVSDTRNSVDAAPPLGAGRATASPAETEWQGQRQDFEGGTSRRPLSAENKAALDEAVAALGSKPVPVFDVGETVICEGARYRVAGQLRKIVELQGDGGDTIFREAHLVRRVLQ